MRGNDRSRSCARDGATPRATIYRAGDRAATRAGSNVFNDHGPHRPWLPAHRAKKELESNMTRADQEFTRVLARRRRRAMERGVTLVEVLIVVAIMALIAGGVSFLVLPRYREAQIKTAKTSARNIRQVATQYLALKSTGGCPTVDTLITEKELDAAGDTKDPWGGKYTISCEDDDVTVSSPGPDKKDGTADDIVAGTKSAAASEG
ncbi:MAG: type II secretion system protein [Myxococcales bacterium]|nr:type II secretion system protein [Myxococcales bacterium]